MKTVQFTVDAAKQLARHGNMRGRIEAALTRYAADPKAGANNVTPLVGSTAFRMRVGDYRVIFEMDATSILVTKVAPRGAAN